MSAPEKKKNTKRRRKRDEDKDDDDAVATSEDVNEQDAQSEEKRSDHDENVERMSNDDAWKTVIGNSVTVPIEIARTLSQKYGNDVAKYEREEYKGLLYERRGKKVNLAANSKWKQMLEATCFSWQHAIPNSSWENGAWWAWVLHVMYTVVYVFSAIGVYVIGENGMTGFDHRICAALLFANAWLHLVVLSPFANNFLRHSIASNYLKGNARAQAKRVFVRMATVTFVLHWMFSLSNEQTVLLIACNALVAFSWIYQAHECVLYVRRFLLAHIPPYMWATPALRNENGVVCLPDPRIKCDGHMTTTHGGDYVYTNSQLLLDVEELARPFSGVLMTGLRFSGSSPFEYLRTVLDHEQQRSRTVLEHMWSSIVAPYIQTLQQTSLRFVFVGLIVYVLQLVVMVSFSTSVFSGDSLPHASADHVSSPFRYIPFAIGCVMPLFLVPSLTHTSKSTAPSNLLRSFVINRMIVCEGFIDACLYLTLSSTLMFHNNL